MKHILAYFSISLIIGLITGMDAHAEGTGFLGIPNTSTREAKIHGHDEGLMNQYGITGNWNGLRDKMQNNGVALEAIYVGEFVRNFDEGTVSNSKKTSYLDNLDLTLTIDTEKAGMWPEGKFFIYGLYNHGGDPSANIIGDLQVASKIEGPNAFLVYEVWYEQSFADGMFSILAGLHDLNSEFYVSDYANLFLNAAAGIGTELTGNVAVSAFAKTGLAVRARVNPIEEWYIQTAIYDGDPSTRNISAKEGRLGIIETGINTDSGSYKAGYWLHTADKTFNGQTFNSDYGYYGIIDQKLIELEDHGSIAGFASWRATPAERNEIITQVAFGFHMHGIIPTRDEDDFGIAYIRANTHTGHETVYELTYRLVMTPWLAVQPSFQWIQNPGGDPAASAIKVGLLQFEVVL
jgi:porin